MTKKEAGLTKSSETTMTTEDEDLTIDELQKPLPELDDKFEKIVQEEYPLTDEQKKFRNERARDEAFVEQFIDSSMMFLINTTYLKDKEKMTLAEIQASMFAKSTVKLINYYFPDWKLDHPILHFAVSTGMIVGIVIAKKELGGVTNDSGKSAESNPQKDANSKPGSGNVVSANPYAGFPG